MNLKYIAYDCAKIHNFRLNLGIPTLMQKLNNIFSNNKYGLYVVYRNVKTNNKLMSNIHIIMRF